jgi:hypothetical protein
MMARSLFFAVALGAVSCGRTSMGEVDAGSSAQVATGAQTIDLLRRWNLAVDSFGGTHTRDFHWYAFVNFPLPTYQGGDSTAYEEFSQVLLRFYQSGDNVEFLRRNLLSQTPLAFGPASTRRATSFCQLTVEMSQISLVSADLQQALTPFGDYLNC